MMTLQNTSIRVDRGEVVVGTGRREWPGAKCRHLQVFRQCAVAALAVVVAHLFSTRWDMGFTQFAGTTIGGFLRFGVDLFFVISGFIIAMTADKIGKTEGRRG